MHRIPENIVYRVTRATTWRYRRPQQYQLHTLWRESPCIPDGRFNVTGVLSRGRYGKLLRPYHSIRQLLGKNIVGTLPDALHPSSLSVGIPCPAVDKFSRSFVLSVQSAWACFCEGWPYHVARDLLSCTFKGYTHDASNALTACRIAVSFWRCPSSALHSAMRIISFATEARIHSSCSFGHATIHYCSVVTCSHSISLSVAPRGCFYWECRPLMQVLAFSYCIDQFVSSCFAQRSVGSVPCVSYSGFWCCSVQ